MEENDTEVTPRKSGETPTAPGLTPEEEISLLAKRIHELEEDLRLEKAKSDDYFRRLQYLQADFENFRKRSEKEISEVKRVGNERLLSDLLLVNDELELALQKATEKNESPTLLEGVGMVHKRLQGLLAKEGIQRIQGVGSKFSPELHEAALRVPSDEEEGTIVEEIRRGYLLKGRVLRASIVKVAENKNDEVETEEKSAV